MASRVTRLLLPLALLLYAAPALPSRHFRMSPPQVTKNLGEQVKLQCEVLSPTSVTGCSWLFQKRGGPTSPVFLMYISKTRIKLAEERNSQRLSGGRTQDSVYSLTLQSFQSEDEGYYFCSIVSNYMLYFSPLVPVFLPGPGAEGAGPLGVGVWDSPLNPLFHIDAPFSSFLAPLGAT